MGQFDFIPIDWPLAAPARRGHIRDMDDYADEGFVALIHIPVPGGAPQREVWLLAFATREECRAELIKMFPSEQNAQITLAQMSKVDLAGFKMKPGDKKPWH